MFAKISLLPSSSEPHIEAPCLKAEVDEARVPGMLSLSLSGAAPNREASPIHIPVRLTRRQVRQLHGFLGYVLGATQHE